MKGYVVAEVKVLLLDVDSSFRANSLLAAQRGHINGATLSMRLPNVNCLSEARFIFSEPVEISAIDQSADTRTV